MNETYQELKKYIEARKRVLVIGNHGTGKTMMCKQIAKELGLRLIYFSCSTLDPYVDVTGIPVPATNDEKQKILEFIKRSDLMKAEWLFLDELNRSHPKVQNALMELVQFGTINGEPLPHLKVTSACINPPDCEMNYHVQELDPAMLDRFHAFMEVKADPNLQVYTNMGFESNKVKAAIAWWKAQSNNIKDYVTPRRLEYILELHRDGFDISKAVLPGRMIATVKGQIPMNTLQQALDNCHNQPAEEIIKDMKIYSADWIAENYDKVVRESFQPDNQALSKSIQGFTIPELNKIRQILPKFADEFQRAIHSHFSPKIEKYFNKFKEKYPELASWSVDVRKSMNEDAKAK